MPTQTDRARGCLLGQLAGDSLGSLVESRTAQDIHTQYPEGVRELADGGEWNTLAGQPTDDSEMALQLARTLIERNTYDADAVFGAYCRWLDSGPFDRGNTVEAGLTGAPDYHSQANGALMRISPLGIFGANRPLDKVAEWARKDAELTHPHPICLQANALFAMAVAHVITTGCTGDELYRHINQWAADMNIEAKLSDCIAQAEQTQPEDYCHQQGWVLVAFQNCLYQLLHAPNLEEGVVDTVMQGGDTDTNAAICGALLGAVDGVESVPAQWQEKVLSCRPQAGLPGVQRPRPECFWPVDALELADSLLADSLLSDSL